MQGIRKGKAMNKQDMIKRFRQEAGSLFVTRGQLACIMGYRDPHSVEPLLVGLERVTKGKLYYIPDVVERIKEGSEFR